VEKIERIMLDVPFLTICLCRFPNTEHYLLDCRDLSISMLKLKETDREIAKKEALYVVFKHIKKIESNLLKYMDNKGAGYTS